MGTWRRPSCTAMVWPTISGKMVESRDQVRNTSLRPPEFIAITRLISLASTKGPFFRLLLMCTNNLAVRSPAHEVFGSRKLRLAPERQLYSRTGDECSPLRDEP